MIIPEGRKGRLDKLYDDETENELQAYINFLRDSPDQDTPRSLYRKAPPVSQGQEASPRGDIEDDDEDGDSDDSSAAMHPSGEAAVEGGGMIKRRGRAFAPELPKSFLPKLLGNRGDFRTVREKAKKKLRGTKFPAKFGVLRSGRTRYKSIDDQSQNGSVASSVSVSDSSVEQAAQPVGGGSAVGGGSGSQLQAKLSPGIGPAIHRFDFGEIDRRQRKMFAEGGVSVQELHAGRLLGVHRDRESHEDRLKQAKENNRFLMNPTVNILEPFERRIVQHRLDAAEPDILNKQADVEIKEARRRKKLEKKLEKRALQQDVDGDGRPDQQLTRQHRDGTRKPVSGEDIAARFEVLARSRHLRDPIGAATGDNGKTKRRRRRIASENKQGDATLAEPGGSQEDDQGETEHDPTWQRGDEEIVMREGVPKRDKVYRSHDLRLAAADVDLEQVESLLDLGLSVNTKDQGQTLCLVTFIRYLKALQAQESREERAKLERKRHEYDDPLPPATVNDRQVPDPRSAEDRQVETRGLASDAASSAGAGSSGGAPPGSRGQPQRTQHQEQVGSQDRRKLKALFRLFLQRGANANELEDPGVAKGWGPLHYAVDSGRLKVVQFLVHEAGAEVNFRTDRRLTPLHMAAGRVDLRMSLFLLRAGANLDSADFRGRAPLHYAAEAGADLVSELLLRAGADNKLFDDDDVPAFELAARQGYNKLASKIRLFTQAHAPRDVLIDFLETTMLKARVLTGQATPEERQAAASRGGARPVHGYLENVRRDIERRKEERAAQKKQEKNEKKKAKRRRAWAFERAKARASWAKKSSSSASASDR